MFALLSLSTISIKRVELVSGETNTLSIKIDQSTDCKVNCVGSSIKLSIIKQDNSFRCSRSLPFVALGADITYTIDVSSTSFACTKYDVTQIDTNTTMLKDAIDSRKYVAVLQEYDAGNTLLKTLDIATAVQGITKVPSKGVKLTVDQPNKKIRAEFSEVNAQLECPLFNAYFEDDTAQKAVSKSYFKVMPSVQFNTDNLQLFQQDNIAEMSALSTPTASAWLSTFALNPTVIGITCMIGNVRKYSIFQVTGASAASTDEPSVTSASTGQRNVGFFNSASGKFTAFLTVDSSFVVAGHVVDVNVTCIGSILTTTTANVSFIPHIQEITGGSFAKTLVLAPVDLTTMGQMVASGVMTCTAKVAKTGVSIVTVALKTPMIKFDTTYQRLQISSFAGLTTSLTKFKMAFWTGLQQTVHSQEFTAIPDTTKTFSLSLLKSLDNTFKIGAALTDVQKANLVTELRVFGGFMVYDDTVADLSTAVAASVYFCQVCIPTADVIDQIVGAAYERRAMFFDGVFVTRINEVESKTPFKVNDRVKLITTIVSTIEPAVKKATQYVLNDVEFSASEEQVAGGRLNVEYNTTALTADAKIVAALVGTGKYITTVTVYQNGLLVGTLTLTGKDRLGAGEIAAIVCGGVVLAGVIVAVAYCYLCHKARRAHADDELQMKQKKEDNLIAQIQGVVDPSRTEI